ncbi:tail protein X [Lacrimispora saccharolytica]|uniref:Phage tail protein gpX n=1 Tax=Lacrimispora saccharolytica (strain ATCC 35040 / DSM 2544 / NRCC 2533 / WM1) TaxID=610130 RepID=D9R636_LACSW|nr:tail protein X [Lacrimispora saccharolytica]ADL03470.1 putative phage tail protein gpX [[Clostridium] saccharolyticum WM1]QRV18379.1 tail protein X [Lacrimispora saccharolytica]
MGNYKTVQGDTWDMIAKKAYGAEKYLDHLMRNNFGLLDYFVFPAGILVNTPSLPNREIIGLPEWRK